MEDSLDVLTDSIVVAVQTVTETPAVASINWSAFGEVILVCCALVGAIVAIVGLSTWRKQLKGRTEYDLARRLMKSAYVVRERFSAYRNPSIFSGETKAALKSQGIVKPSDSNYIGMSTVEERAVYSERGRYLGEAISDMEIEALEAEVLWGKEVQEHMGAIRTLRGRLLAATWMYFRLKSNPNLSLRQVTQVQEVEGIIWEIKDEEPYETFTREIQAAISTLETFIKPKLSL